MQADGDEGLRIAHQTMGRAYSTAGTSVHWYGKEGCGVKRKIGHINIVGDSREQARERLDQISPGASASLQDSAARSGTRASAEVAIIMGSDSDLPTMAGAAKVCFTMSRCIHGMVFSQTTIDALVGRRGSFK